MKKPEHQASLSRFRVVLVRPKDPRNIGSVCRAMKTMGLTDLAIVCEKPIKEREAVIAAVHASDILEKSRRLASLDEALADTILAAGVTRRRGKFRKYYSLTPEEFAAQTAGHKKGTAAIVFGTEEYGLVDSELERCQLAVHIPSSPLFPSLNLSHAVQIISYALFREAHRKLIHNYTPVTLGELEGSVSQVIDLLAPLGFYKNEEAGNLAVLLKDMLGRSRLSKSELDRFLTLFKKISGVFSNLKKHAGRPHSGIDNPA